MWNVRLCPSGLRRDGKNYRLQDIQLSFRLKAEATGFVGSYGIRSFRLQAEDTKFFDIVWDDSHLRASGASVGRPT
jgi:hypothetical protein